MDIFIEYDDIIKTQYPMFLKTISTTHLSLYKHYLDIGQFANMDIHDINIFLLSRLSINPLDDLILNPINTHEILSYFKNNDETWYINGSFLYFSKVIDSFITTNDIDNIFIWSPMYDDRISIDISLRFKHTKIKYISGSIDDIYDQYNFTIMVIRDIFRVKHLIESKKTQPKKYFIPVYGYNTYIHETLGLIPRIETLFDDVRKLGSELILFLPYKKII